MDISSRDRASFSYAAGQERKGVSQLLIGTPGVDANYRGKIEWTPPFYPVDHGSEGVIQLLIDTLGVDVDSSDEPEQTAL